MAYPTLKQQAHYRHLAVRCNYYVIHIKKFLLDVPISVSFRDECTELNKELVKVGDMFIQARINDEMTIKQKDNLILNLRSINSTFKELAPSFRIYNKTFWLDTFNTNV